MDIEQRLEAIVQTLELVSGMQLKTEKELKRLGSYVRIIARDYADRLALEDADEEDEE